MSKKFVYQVGNNKKVILWCTANQISRLLDVWGLTGQQIAWQWWLIVSYFFQTDIFEPSSNDWLSVEAPAELGGNELLCYQSYTDGDGCHAAAQSTCCASSDVSQQPQQSVEVSGSSQSLHPNSWIPNNILSQYSPTLNASDNPYYYESNKLLFALYMERIHRNGDIVYWS